MLTASENWARTPPAALLVDPDPSCALLDHDHAADAGPAQLVGGAQADHPAADDDDRRLGREVGAAGQCGHSSARRGTTRSHMVVVHATGSSPLGMTVIIEIPSVA